MNIHLNIKMAIYINFKTNTRLSSIASQPKKDVVVSVVVVTVIFVVVIIVFHRNLTLKFGQNWVNNKTWS